MGWTDSEGVLTDKGINARNTTTGMTSAINMIGGTWAGINLGKANKRVNNALAEVSDIQADIEIQKAKQEDLYSNEANALRGWGAARELRALKGAQSVSSAVSGTYGHGDQRIVADAENKAYMQQRDMLRALQLESFERIKGSKMRAAGLKGRARQYRLGAKRSVLIGGLSGAAKGLSDTSKYLSTMSTFWKKGSEEK
jgi:hypothetical protein